MKKVLKPISICLVIVLVVGAVTFQYSRSWKNALFIEPIYRIPTDEKVVALTFDDGPSKARTPALLEVLSKYEIKATFFMLGQNIEKYPEVAQMVYDQGHLIGNHSYSHPRLIFKPPSFIVEQIAKTDSLIRSIGQGNTQYFRPPYSSKYVVLPLVLNGMQKELVTGSFDPPSEYISPYDALAVANEVIENSEPGSIIYLHDGKASEYEQFAKSVELIIIGLKEKGFRFVTLDDQN